MFRYIHICEMTDSINQRKIDFIDCYIKDGLSISSESSYIIQVSKYLISALKFNDIEIEKLIEITSKTLQEVIKNTKNKPEKIPGFTLDKNLNGDTRYVDFFVEGDQIVSKIHKRNNNGL